MQSSCRGGDIKKNTECYFIPIFGEPLKNCLQEDRDNLLSNSIYYQAIDNGKKQLWVKNLPISKELRFDCDYRNAISVRSDLMKVLNLCLEQVPGILHDAICTAFRSHNALLNDYNNVNIKDKIYTHKTAASQLFKIRHLDTLLRNLNLSYEHLFSDLKQISSTHNIAESLILNNNNNLMALLESRLKIHQKEHTDILKPFKSKREYQDHLNLICKKLYGQGKKYTLKQSECDNPQVFEQIFESISYFKRNSIASSLNDNYGLAQTTMLSISFYLIAIRSMFKIQTPKRSLSVAYTPVQIMPPLVLGALQATSRVIEFMGRHNRLSSKNYTLPKLKDFTTILRYFIQGNIKIMYCANCGSASLVFADSVGTDMLDKGFLYLCHSCETGQKDRFIFIDNVVQCAYKQHIKFYTGNRKKLSRNTISNNTRHLNSYNPSYIGALEYMTRHFSSDKRQL
ncbi:Uncharacterised protein [Anaerobiospirillum thomasii]|uniref:hypothetical protein n=2 Tax=Gammaproteobacteria TaxID=1236 RepID=UPI000D87349F|nr:hypothetical protein [Anaerobiospirillum thomasii]SPT68146.1 Uncharacterised protein [Anaerobiospirillum thomasii]